MMNWVLLPINFKRTSMMLMSYMTSNVPFDQGQKQLIKMLVTDKEEVPIEPPIPITAAVIPEDTANGIAHIPGVGVGSLQIQNCMYRLKDYETALKAVESGKMRMFALIWNPCLLKLQTRLKAIPDFETLKTNNNILTLLHNI